MGKTLDSLRYLANMKNGFEMDSNDDPKNQDADKRFESIKKSPKKVKSTTDFIAESRRTLRNIREENFSDFEDGIEELLELEEDEELKNSLLSMGRKYARDNSSSEESSEIQKAFIPQETKLNSLLTAITKDTVLLEKDIEELRMARTRNYARLNEMVSTKAQYQDAQLKVIKEMSAIKKMQFELKQKLKENTGDGDNTMATQSVIQSLFNIGQNELLSSVGGRASSSGSYIDDDYDDYDTDTDSSYHEAMNDAAAVSKDENLTDGDKFTKYENSNVEYVLERNKSDDTVTVYAEDKDGNVISDYPMPSDIDSLSFDINEKGGFAQDQYARRYKLRDI